MEMKQHMNRVIMALIFTLFSMAAHSKSCPFCSKEVIEESSVYESESFHVLLDHEPRVPGHLLVTPKRHVAKAHELSSQEWSELSDLIPKIVAVFKIALDIDDYIILEKNGRNAFQQIPHVHFHLFPIHSQTWLEIFDIVPKRLAQGELERQIELFRSYFGEFQ